MATVRTVALLAALGLTPVAAQAARRVPPPPPPVATPAPPTIKSGVEKWRAGDYAAAVAIWTPFAAAGDPDAMFNVGQAYKLGRGVTADPVVARDYYRKAATKGHLPAQANLGIALFQAGEKPEAIKWLRTAADRGEARAQYVLGIAAFNGDGVPRSQSLGYGYLLRAQASGLPQAVTALGTIAPGLSPADRTTGEAVAASLAAGTGVPAAYAAASGPRLIAGPLPRTLPVVTPPPATPPPATPPAAAPIATAAPSSASSGLPTRTASATAALAPVPGGPATTTSGATALVPAKTTAPADPRAPNAPADKAALPPVPKPYPALPLRQPTPAQADAAALAAARAASERRTTATGASDASAAPPAIGTVAIPASRPASAATGAPPPVDVASAGAPPPRPAIDPLAPKAASTALAAKAADRPAPVKPPTDPRAAPLKPFEVAVAETPKKPDGWRVQLGAFSSRKLADAAWADVKPTAAPAKPVFATDGPVTKLQMGPFATRDAAKAACTKLTAAGRACFVTAG